MKRLRWYTGNPIQTKYLIVVFLAMLMPLLIMVVCMSYLFKIFVMAYGALPTELYADILSLYQQMKYFWSISLSVMVATMLFISLYISHRLIGPITRMERELDKVLAGDLNIDIHVRAKDDLKGISDRINQLIVRMRPR